MTKRERRLPSGLSPTSLELFHQCPRRFEEEKINGLFSPPGKEAVLGTFVHLVLEILMQGNPEERTLERAREIATEVWPTYSERGDFKRLHLDPQGVKWFKHSAWGSIENYFQMENPEEVEVVATEQRINCEINGVPVRGIIDRLDRVDDVLVVSDYKNGKVTDAKYMGPKRDQLNMYAAMINATEGEIPLKGRLLYTAHGIIHDVEFSPESVDALTSKTAKAWEKIHANYEGGHFPPNPGPLCGWCPALEKCAEGMGHVTMQHRRGRLKKTAPGYALVATPRRRRR